MTSRVLVVLAAAVTAVLLVGCDRLQDAADGVYQESREAAAVLRAPAGSHEPDLDLHREWRAAGAQQRLASRHRVWALRPFTEFVVVGGVGHRALLLLPSLDGKTSTASFKIAVPVESDDEFVASTVLFPKFAPESDGVEVGWAVGEATGAPDALPGHFERLAGGKRPDHWREVRVDLAPYRGRTIWIVLAARESGDRHADWLLWGDPRVRPKRRPEPVVVDLGASDPALRRMRAVPWEAATVFKTYSLFNAVARARPAEWMREAYPWLTSLRILSALGANFGPTLAEEDARRVSQGEKAKPWEAEWAGRYEFFRDGLDRPAGPVAEQFEWKEFDELNATAAATGFDLHLNMTGAPERFTNGKGSYPTYRFNELPVVDELGWKEYVGTLFRHLGEQPWADRASFSFFSEPNCMWIEADGQVRKIGYQGDAEQYARQYLWTWQAMRSVIGEAPVYLGPWVVEPDRGEPILDNLSDYLRAIIQAFNAAGEPLPPWSAFSFNLYETPHLTLDSFASYKIAEVRRVLAEVLGRADLPIQIDELGIHPLVSNVFQEATGIPLGSTRWEMAWHAEMSALLVDQGIRQAASWYPILMLYPQDQSLRAYASYLFASVVVGAVDWTAQSDGTLAIAAAPGGRQAPADVSVRLAGRNADRIGYLSAIDPSSGSHRIAVWNYPRSMATDEYLGAREPAATLEIRLPPRAAGAWHVRLLGYEDQAPLADDTGVQKRLLRVGMFPGLPRFALRELDSERLTLTLAPGSLYLVELE